MDSAHPLSVGINKATFFRLDIGTHFPFSDMAFLGIGEGTIGGVYTGWG